MMPPSPTGSAAVSGNSPGWQRVAQRLVALLNEPVMGFLALVAVGAGVAPMMFALPPAVGQFCDLAGWAVVAAFSLEYVANLAAAQDRRRFVVDPWHVLDALIVIAALTSLLPVVSDMARLSPVLRVLRLLRVVLFGARVGHGLRRRRVLAVRPPPTGAPLVTVLRPADTAPREGGWNDLLLWASSPASDWLHASNLSPGRLKEVATSAGVPHVMIEAALHESSYPRLEVGERWTALTLSVPSMGEGMHRDPVLLLISRDGVLSLAVHPLDLQRAPEDAAAIPWGPRCALCVIRHVLAHNEEMAGRLERSVRQLEELPPGDSPESFFEQTFRLKRLLSSAKGDLRRLRGLLQMLADGRRELPGLEREHRAPLRELADEADYWFETVEDVRESVLSLIDLHINIAGHDMNRFMRLLAIVSVLALIPAIAGGLLGMNLADSPWAVTLGEVAFVTFVLMLGVLYAFMAKGWIR